MGNGFEANENQEQNAVVEWLRLKKILHFGIPNGIPSNPITGKRFKNMGLSSGVPDLCVPIPNNAYHSLYIEMKPKRGGVVSPNQKLWLEALNSHGHLAVVCYGFDEAQKVIEDYLMLK